MVRTFELMLLIFWFDDEKILEKKALFTGNPTLPSICYKFGNSLLLWIY